MADLAALERFKADWLAQLNHGAHAVIECALRDQQQGAPSAIADRFVSALGYSPIGYNWELLDAFEIAAGPRSAYQEIIAAVSADLSNPNRPWLSQDQAEACAAQFLEAFAAPARTVLANRYDGLWNPIAGQAIEWGFVGYDDDCIGLLLLTANA